MNGAEWLLFACGVMIGAALVIALLVGWVCWIGAGEADTNGAPERDSKGN